MPELLLSEPLFRAMARMVYDKSGIFLDASRRGLLSHRLAARLKALGIADFDTYFCYVRSPAGYEAEATHFLDAITTNETHFFRNRPLWQEFEHEVIAHFARTRSGAARRLRIWSAACSSGEEAYTCAILLRERLPDIDAWQIDILATDISSRSLEWARRGVYHDHAVSRIGPERQQRWFDREGGAFRVKDDICRMVSFRFHNLKDSLQAEPFDVVILRNVMMYFDQPMKERVIHVVTAALRPEGRLVVGDVDPIRAAPELQRHSNLACLRPGLYVKCAKRAAIAEPSSPIGHAVTATAITATHDD